MKASGDHQAEKSGLSVREIGQSIGEIEQTVGHVTNDETIEVSFPHALLIRIFGNTEEFRHGMIPTLVLEKTQLFGILETVLTLC